MTYPQYYKRDLCCNQVRYLRRTEETKADVVVASDGVAVHRSVATYANDKEFTDRLSGYRACEAEEFDKIA